MAPVSMGAVPFTRAIDFSKRPRMLYGALQVLCYRASVPLGGEKNKKTRKDKNNNNNMARVLFA